MRYNIKRWYDDKDIPRVVEDCERLEVVKQVIKAIDNAENFEATVCGPEGKEE